jgi:hypothetical protein
MPNALGIVELTSAQYEAYATVNLQLKYLSALATGARTRATAVPGSPVENACYIAASGSITGAWSAFAVNDLIFYLGAAWYRLAPVEGLCVWVWDENCVYEYPGSAWQKRTLTTIPAAGNWKLFHSNGSGVVTELALDIDGAVLRSNGAAAAPSFTPALLRLASVAGVDLNQTTSKTTLYTVPTGRTFVPTLAVIRAPTATAVNAIVGLGGDANATDWAAAVALTGLDGSTKVKLIEAGGVFPAYAAGAVFGIKPTQAQGAAVTATVDVCGYLY